MKFIITNAQEDSMDVVVSSTNMETQTIAHLLKEIYRSNKILSKYITFETYQQIVQLSYQDVILTPDTLLKDAFGEKASGENIITLTLELAQNLDPIQECSLFDLTLLKPPVIPEDLYCPISCQVFYHPVKYYYGEEKDKDGNIVREATACTVENESLLHIASNPIIQQRRCPFTRVPLSVEVVNALETDIEKQQQVVDFFDSYKESGYHKRLKKEQYQETNLPIFRAPQRGGPTNPTLDDQAVVERLLRGNNAQQQPALLAQFPRQGQPRARILNSWENEALNDFRTHALTADMLLNRNTNGHEFCEYHCYALHNLVRRDFTLPQALAEIDGLSSQQAMGITEGLLREDVIRLDNLWHIETLIQLKIRGLTPDILLNLNTGSHRFCEDHCYALCNLVLRRDFTLQQALVQIEELSLHHVTRIREGSTRDQVLNEHSSREQPNRDPIFFNPPPTIETRNPAQPIPRTLNNWENATLNKLGTAGLTAQMLLERNRNNHEFDDSHSFALCRLVARGLTIQQALAQIEGLSWRQAEGIKDGLTRDDVIRLNNHWHISALTQLKNRGLTPDMLLNLNTNNNEFNSTHYAVLYRLVDGGLTIQNALAQIDGLSSEQVSRMMTERATREQVLNEQPVALRINRASV